MTSKNNEDQDDLDTPGADDEPGPRQRGRRRRPYRRQSDPMIIERVETTDMTPEQYSSAVTALAALIERWQQDRYTGSDFGDAAV